MKRVSDRNGDAVMVTTVLMLSIILSVGGKLVLDYGEIVGKEQDMLHASDVSDSMLSMRASMSTLLEAGDTDTSILNRITLGTYGNPYLGVARSSGRLVYSPAPEDFLLSVFLEEGGSETLLNSVSGSLVFESNNFYYIDQVITFQSGGLVLDEYGRCVMSEPALFEVVRTSSGWGVDLELFTLTGEHWSTSGIDSTPLTIGLDGYSEISRDLSAGQVVSMRFNGPGEKAWEYGIRSLLTGNGLIENVDFSVTRPSDWSSSSEYLEIDLTGMKTVHLLTGEMEVRICSTC